MPRTHTTTTPDSATLRTLTDEPQALCLYLKTLSNARFKHAGTELGERILPEVETECFWAVFTALFRDNRKAYLGTLLKALAIRLTHPDGTPEAMAAETDALWDEAFRTICLELTDMDRRKILLALLPLLPTHAMAERLLRQCGLAEPSAWIPILLQVRTAPCAFLLLKSLRYVEHDRALLIRTCHFLIKTGDGLCFNLASLLRTSFGLEEVRGTFSLTLKPYQLSRIEQNYEAFLTAIRF